MGKKKQEKGSSVDIDSNSTSSCSTVSDKKVLTLNSIMSEENEMGPPQNPPLSPLPADDGGGAENYATAAATFRYPGVEMAAASFTPAQWRELERQAMIYKYMMASVPVPPDLLFSVLSPRTDDPSSYPYPYPYPYFPWMNGNGGSYFRNNKDLEPGRCKRTDGKKWRCSRDVAPHQKYCERHMHRGRPRSRKHVEIHQTSVESGGVSATAGVGGGGCGATKKSRLRVDLPPRFLETHKPKESMFVDPPSIFPPSDHFKQPNRVFGWEMEGGNTEQQWLDFMETKRGMDSINGFNSVLQQGYVEEVQIQEQQQQQQPLSLFSYGMESIDDRCHLFLNSDHHHHHQEINTPTRGFIDAWSNGNGDVKSTIPASSSSCSSNLNLWPPCDDTLTLSMALDAAGMGHAPPVSWQPFHSGGPLAEVLGPASPYPGNGDSISPPGTSVTSPRGILHRAVFSDGSVGNSPTLAASRAAPDLVAFQWLN